MAGIKNYSTTPASNATVGSVNFAEGQVPSTVNDSARQFMADMRSWYETTEFRDWGHTVTYATATTFTVATDVTSIYTVNRPIRCTDSVTLYGYVSASSYSSPNTTVTVVLHSGSLSASLTAVALGIDGGTNSVPIQALSGLTTTGDLLYASAANTPARLAAALQGDTLRMGTSTPQWGGSVIDVRQTVLAGSVDANGQANFLAAGTGLAVNLSATAVPLVIAFAAGFDGGGPVDHIGYINADLASAWSGLTDATTNYLYIDRNTTTGALTYGFTTLAPTYGYGTTKSTTNNQHTFRIDEMKMYVGNGTAASSVQRVFVGKAVTSGGAVTSVTTYWLKGRGYVDTAALAVNTAYTLSPCLGARTLAPIAVSLVNLVADAGYSVGDEIQFWSNDYDGTTDHRWVVSAGNDVLYFSSPINSFVAVTKGTSTISALATGSWKFRARMKRGW